MEECLYAPEIGCHVVVYVDDFKMAGPKENLSKAWDLVKTKIKRKRPRPLSVILVVNMCHLSIPCPVHLIHE